MTDQSSIFPAFIRAEYDPSGNGFSIFEREAGESAARARRAFEANFAEVARVVNGALSRGIKPSGAMDLGLADMRQAAAQARAYEQALRTTRDAAQQMAAATGDTSAETRSYLQALSAQVIEADRATQAADAQVTTYSRLQSQIDATAARNSVLAASYREIHLEQARATNRAHYAQTGYTEVFAPGLSRSATDNGAGYAALEAQLVRQQDLVRDLNAGVAELERRFASEAIEQARAAEQATAALQRQTAALEELRRAEAGAANGAAMLNAIMRETGAGATSSNSAAASASAFEQQFAQQARAAEQYAQAAAQLRAELDPMYLAQQRFDREMDRADDLLKAGAISTREYAQAQQQARASLQAHNAAVHSQNDAFRTLAKGSGVLRQAYVQSGQQMQDVVISLVGGQRASVVFAQQLPQLAFALSGLGMQADGTQKGIGRIAALLSGPWGVAFAGAAFVVGGLVGKLWEQDKASKAAEDAAKKHQAAIEALNEAMERSIQTAETKARKDYETLHVQREKTLETRRETAALLENARVRAERLQRDPGTATSNAERASAIAAAEAEYRRLAAALKEAEDAVAEAERKLNLGRANYQSEILDAMRTPEGRAKRRYETEINVAKERGASAEDLERLYRARDAELKKIQEAEKALQSSGSARDREAATVSQVSKLLISAFGGTITSTTGGKHVKGSYHYKGQAVDFVPAGGMGAITKEQIRTVAQAAGLQIKELLGPGDKGHNNHFHLAWAGGKGEIDSQRIADQLAREAERRAAEAQRLAEELDRAARSLFSRFDEGRAAALDYGDALAEIDRVMKAGLISPDDALAYSVAAAQQKAANDNERNRRAMEQLDKDLWGDRKKPQQLFNEEQKAALRRQSELAREAAINIDRGLQQLADFFGNDLAHYLDELRSHAKPGGELGQLLGGIGIGRDKMWEGLSRQFESALKKSGLNADGLGQTIGTMMAGAEMGRLFGKGITDIFGVKGSKLGSEIGGAIGSAIGGPLGAVAGGLIGSITGGLFKTAKWGTATVTGQDSGDVQVAGNKSAYRSNANLAGTSIQSGLDRIAEQLGVDIGGYNVSIGQYKGKWRVSTDGRTGKLKMKSSRPDIEDFGKDGAEDAIKYAIADAVKDGALLGLRASTQALLARSDDIEAQLQKALDFENVFHRLKEHKDPVGAALDTLDKEFKRLKKIFDEAGASAGEYAELEELYGIERANAVRQAGEKVTASLKSLFDELTIGNDARSLRERMVEAQAQYSPLAQRVAGGDVSAYDDYADAARTMLDLQRQIYGSSEDYFRMLDEVTNLTRTRIDAETNIASIAAERDSLNLAPMVSATETQTQQIVAALAAQNGNMSALLQSILNNQVLALRAANANGAAASTLTAARANF